MFYKFGFLARVKVFKRNSKFSFGAQVTFNNDERCVVPSALAPTVML